MLERMIPDIVDFLSGGGWIPVIVAGLLLLAYSLSDRTSQITSHGYNKSRPN